MQPCFPRGRRRKSGQWEKHSDSLLVTDVPLSAGRIASLVSSACVAPACKTASRGTQARGAPLLDRGYSNASLNVKHRKCTTDASRDAHGYEPEVTRTPTHTSTPPAQTRFRLHTFFSHAMGARQRMDVLGRRRDGYARLHNSASSPAVCWNRTCCRSLVLLRRNVTRQTGRRVEASGLSTRKGIFQSTLASVLDPFLA